MVKIKDQHGIEFAMDNWLYQNLQIVKKLLRDDFDCVFLLSGGEGEGKSHLAQQICSVVDPTFNVDRMCVTADEFIEQVMIAPKFSAVSYDEAMGGLSATDALTKTTKALVKMFAEVRQRNLFLVVTLPSYFDLGRNIALHRSRALLHVYLGDKFKRGQFLFFNKEKKKNLYIKGKKFMDYKAEKANFFAKFSYHWCINEEVYKQKKTDTLKRYLKEIEAKGNSREISMERKYMKVIGAYQVWLKEEKRFSLNSQREKINDYTGLGISKGTFNEIYRDTLAKGVVNGYVGFNINNTPNPPLAQKSNDIPPSKEVSEHSNSKQQEVTSNEEGNNKED